MKDELSPEQLLADRCAHIALSRLMAHELRPLLYQFDETAAIENYPCATFRICLQAEPEHVICLGKITTAPDYSHHHIYVLFPFVMFGIFTHLE